MPRPGTDGAPVKPGANISQHAPSKLGANNSSPRPETSMGTRQKAWPGADTAIPPSQHRREELDRRRRNAAKKRTALASSPLHLFTPSPLHPFTLAPPAVSLPLPSRKRTLMMSETTTRYLSLIPMPMLLAADPATVCQSWSLSRALRISFHASRSIRTVGAGQTQDLEAGAPCSCFQTRNPSSFPVMKT